MAFQEFSAADYLRIDIANNYGLDKENWDYRIKWFDENEANLDNLITQAEEPALFFAGVKAWNQSKEGKPIGYGISLDATSSGIQLLSLLSGCRTSASICNVVDTGQREDAYTAVYAAMCERIGEKAKIERKDAKAALMTAMYSSKAVPAEVFGEGELLETFYTVVHEKLPGAWALNEAFLALWQKQNLSHDWVLPDNFHVHIKVMGTVQETIHFMNRPYRINIAKNMPSEEGRSLGANVCHSLDGMVVREIIRRCNYNVNQKENVLSVLVQSNKAISVIRDKDKMLNTMWNHYINSGFLSARILDYIDQYNIDNVDRGIIHKMIDTFPEKPFKVLTIHDCFRVHPNYGNDLRKQYNQILYEIGKSNMLQYIVEQITGRQINVVKKDNFADEILESNYALS